MTRTVDVVQCNVGSALTIVIIVVAVIIANTAANGADEPGGAAGSLPGPVLLEVILAGLELATREKDDDGDEAIEDGVDKDAAGNIVSWDLRGRIGELTR